MPELLFMIPFKAEWPALLKLMKSLNLRPKRMDSWDSQAGYRIIGTTGAIRIFRLENPGGEPDQVGYYELHGISADKESKSSVEKFYEYCFEAVCENFEIDNGRLIEVKNPLFRMNVRTEEFRGALTELQKARAELTYKILEKKTRDEQSKYENVEGTVSEEVHHHKPTR